MTIPSPSAAGFLVVVMFQGGGAVVMPNIRIEANFGDCVRSLAVAEKERREKFIGGDVRCVPIVRGQR